MLGLTRQKAAPASGLHAKGEPGAAPAPQCHPPVWKINACVYLFSFTLAIRVKDLS